ncbi:MAG: hypothetical protein QOJ69_2258 [Actinomycetota bacterium]|nr:hypothetical protein [Actinomycetota bacterium]
MVTSGADRAARYVTAFGPVNRTAPDRKGILYRGQGTFPSGVRLISCLDPQALGGSSQWARDRPRIVRAVPSEFAERPSVGQQLALHGGKGVP